MIQRTCHHISIFRFSFAHFLKFNILHFVLKIFSSSLIFHIFFSNPHFITLISSASFYSFHFPYYFSIFLLFSSIFSSFIRLLVLHLPFLSPLKEGASGTPNLVICHPQFELLFALFKRNYPSLCCL